MLMRYFMRAREDFVITELVDGSRGGEADEESPSGWVRYEDAEALQMRVIELEQKLKKQDELKAEFERECEQ